MIEIVVVLIILAIVTTVIAYRPTTTSNDLIAQTEILRSHLRYAQIRALNDTVLWGIYISDAGSYILYKNNAQAASQLPGENGQTHTLPTAVTITGGAGTAYNFNEWGTPVDAGGAAIATLQTITLSQETATSDITITKNTGFIP